MRYIYRIIKGREKYYCELGYIDTHWLLRSKDVWWSLDKLGNAMSCYEDRGAVAWFNNKEEALQLINKANKYRKFKVIS